MPLQHFFFYFYFFLFFIFAIIASKKQANPYLQQLWMYAINLFLIQSCWWTKKNKKQKKNNKEVTFKIHKKKCKILFFPWYNHIGDRLSEYGESCIYTSHEWCFYFVWLDSKMHQWCTSLLGKSKLSFLVSFSGWFPCLFCLGFPLCGFFSILLFCIFLGYQTKQI